MITMILWFKHCFFISTGVRFFVLYEAKTNLVLSKAWVPENSHMEPIIRSGRPRSTRTPDKIKEVQAKIQQNQGGKSIRMLAAECNINEITVRRIIKYDLTTSSASNTSTVSMSVTSALQDHTYSKVWLEKKLY